MKCSVPCCESRRDTAVGKMSFFEIPENLKLKTAWLNIIFNEAKKYKLDLKLPDKAVICEKHFTKADFSVSTQRRKLLPNSIPTVFSGDTVYKLPVYKVSESNKKEKTLISASYNNLSLKKTDVDISNSEPCTLLDPPREHFDESLCVQNNSVKSKVAQSISNINQYEQNKVITISLHKNLLSTLSKSVSPKKSYLNESSSKQCASLDLSEKCSNESASAYNNNVKCEFAQNVSSINQYERNKVITIKLHKTPISTSSENACLVENNSKQCEYFETHFDKSASVPSGSVCNIKCKVIQNISNRFHKIMPEPKEKKDLPISTLSENSPLKTLLVKNISDSNSSMDPSNEHFDESESVQSYSDNSIKCNVVQNRVSRYQSERNKYIVNTLHKKLRYLRKVNFALCNRVKELNNKISALKFKTNEEKQLEKIIMKGSENKLCAVILLDQIRNFEKKKVTSSSMALKHYMLWQKCSPAGYDFIKSMGIFTLPHKHILKNSSLISQNKLENIANVALASP